MTLETLFAQAGQSRAFLLLMAGGVLLGAILEGAELARKKSKLLGGALDAASACLMVLMILHATLLSGGGLRIYALLGLLIGLLLYDAGVRRVVAALVKRGQKTFGPKAGMRPADAESSKGTL